MSGPINLPEKKEGFFSRFFKGGKKLDGVTIQKVPKSKIDLIKDITSKKDHELTAAHLNIEPKEPNGTDQKLAA